MAVNYVTDVPVAIICKAVLYPGFSFGLRGQQSIHLHHQVAGPEREAALTHLTRLTERELWGNKTIPVLLHFKLLDFAFDALPGCL